MAPREDDEESSVVVIDDLPMATSPSSFGMRRFGKEGFFHERIPSVDLSIPDDHVEAAVPLLSESLALLLSRGMRLLDEIDDRSVSDNSIVSDACRVSLRHTMTAMVEEALSLLNTLGTEPISQVASMTAWRVSLAQIRAEAYLEAIQSAWNFPNRERLEDALFTLVDSISVQRQSTASEQKVQDESEALLRISPWTMPSLAFDLTVGSPVRFDLAPKPLSPIDFGLPLKVDVRAIVEILGKDVGTEKSLGCASKACTVHVVKCVHETRASSISGGTVGDVLLRVRLSPFGGLGKGTNDRPWTTDKNIVGSLSVKEARVVQVNAYYPRPKATVDLFVSSNHGESDTTVSIRFQTVKTRNEAIPDLHIELVMG